MEETKDLDQAKRKEKQRSGVIDFAERAGLSSNLPAYAAITLYMLCPFEGWIEAFNSVDEDPLTKEEVENVTRAIANAPVDPHTWSCVLLKLLNPAEDIFEGKHAQEASSIDLLVAFSRATDFDVEWAQGKRPGVFIKVLRFYMALYSQQALEWVTMFSKMYHIDIPYDMTERLSRWRKEQPHISHDVLCMFARTIKRAAM